MFERSCALEALDSYVVRRLEEFEEQLRTEGELLQAQIEASKAETKRLEAKIRETEARIRELDARIAERDAVLRTLTAELEKAEKGAEERRIRDSKEGHDSNAGPEPGSESDPEADDPQK
ncbi:hypothetical protein A4X09_0g260 [Tilletia walkeri]|uniref:Uncharacterized protein n=1 Tax=Tilletia walkeri TaxID=117179 RepID=A0A8X7NFF8_9BASI|nr:hypothetical protein A4X09_0g260 [Tilletia walkeri]